VGLVYLRARWYDGRVGRFTRKDVWGGNVQQPQTLNDFTYATANPINQTDPSGRQPPTPPPPTPEPPGPEPVPTPPPPPPPVANTVLLEQSVRIWICELVSPCDAREAHTYMQICHGGLGTIVNTGDTVLTHNHWAAGSQTFWRNADSVVFINHRGERSERIRLRDIDRRFRRNPGTLLLDLPPGVNLNGTPATVGHPDTLSPGDWVQIVYHDEGADQMNVMMRRLRRLGRYRGEPTAIFKNHSDNPSEFITHGDSGGGVFAQGRLVANTWWIQDPYILTTALVPDGM